MSLESQYDVRVDVIFNGETTQLGTFDKMSGGEVDSSNKKYRPGGMKKIKNLGGRRLPSDCTVSRLCELEGDHQRLGWLMEIAGKADVVITKQPLDVNGNAFGDPLVYTGKLKKVSPPDADSESDDEQTLELEIGVEDVTQ